MKQFWRGILVVGGIGLMAVRAWAGPPYLTDDPEPVEYQHWEVYVASIINHDSSGTAGTAPHVEVNYGLVPELQLHLIAPAAFSAPKDGSLHIGYGDTELGAKYRFMDETTNFPQIGVFPLLEVPTGDSSVSSSGGHLQAFLPVWMQKSWGNWTAYGGAGYWFKPGPGNHDWVFMGALLQRQVTGKLAIGTEFFHETAQTIGGSSETWFNGGAVYDFNEHHHLMFSIGHTVQGPGAFDAYLGFQFTFGPEKKDQK